MKITNLLAIAVLGLASAGANAATVWEPTNEDVDFLTFSLAGIDLNGASLAMFDDADFGGTALNIGTAGGEVRFTASGSDYFAEAFDGDDVSIDGPILLTDSPWFVLGITYNSGASWIGDTSFDPTSSPDTYVIHFGSDFGDASVVGVDLGPAVVPVPAAAWLFGTGLIGLVGVARRRA